MNRPECICQAKWPYEGPCPWCNEESEETAMSEPVPCLDCVIVRIRMRDGRNCAPGESGTWQVRHVIVCPKHQQALEKDLEKLAERMRAVCGAHSRT